MGMTQVILDHAHTSVKSIFHLQFQALFIGPALWGPDTVSVLADAQLTSTSSHSGSHPAPRSGPLSVAVILYVTKDELNKGAKCKNSCWFLF